MPPSGPIARRRPQADPCSPAAPGWVAAPVEAGNTAEGRCATSGPRLTRNVLGLMAGTSGDGIDAACVRIEGTGPGMRVCSVLHHHEPFAPLLRRRLVAAMAPARTTTQEIARLHADLGEAFARAALAAVRRLPAARRPSLIGLAGQTVCHLPDVRPYKTVTLQLGDPARVAARTGLTTVADFRQSDIAAGGQGAPLVPWTDWVLFRHPRIPRVIQNVGGIANLTYLPPGGAEEDVIAFDTGPGNMVIDALVAAATGGRQRMDRDGRRAARGRVLQDVLDLWLRHPFLRRPPPKSTGREVFGSAFVEAERPRLRRASRCPDDWIATATAFTACAIARAARRFLPLTLAGPGRSPSRRRPAPEWIVCGGGAKNPVLMGFLAARLPGVVVRPIDALGIAAQAKEAVSFALLAAARLDGVPANLPRVTGARRRTLLGQVTVNKIY